MTIKNAVEKNNGKGIPILPLKQSAAFDAIFEKEKSIPELINSSKLAAYQYREVVEQFDAIYHLIDTHYAK